MFSSSDTDEEPGSGGKLVIDLEVDTDLTPRKPTGLSNTTASPVCTARRRVNLDEEMNTSKVQANSVGTISLAASGRLHVGGAARDSVAAKTWVPKTIVSASGQVSAQKSNKVVDAKLDNSDAPAADRALMSSQAGNISSSDVVTSSLTTVTTSSYNKTKVGINQAQPTVGNTLVNQTVAKLETTGQPSPVSFSNLIPVAASSKVMDSDSMSWSSSSSSSSSCSSGNKPVRMKIKGIQSSPTVSATSSHPLLTVMTVGTARVIGDGEVGTRSPSYKKCRGGSRKEASLGKTGKSNSVEEGSLNSNCGGENIRTSTEDMDTESETKFSKSQAGSPAEGSGGGCGGENSLDPYEFNVKTEEMFERPCKKMKTSDRSDTSCSPVNHIHEGASLPSDPPEMKDAAVDACHVGVITDPDCLGPCEPGTSVTLEGIVWNETDNGLLVVNVTWRGRTYVGTLIDATKHDWAPPRSSTESPVTDLEGRTTKVRGGKRGRACTSNTSRFDASCDRKLRSNRCSNSRMPSLPPPPPILPPPSPLKDPSSLKRPRVDLSEPCPSRRIDTVETLIECPQSGCCKKFKSTHALRFHQTKAHKSLCGDIMTDAGGEMDTKKCGEGRSRKKNDSSDENGLDEKSEEGGMKEEGVEVKVEETCQKEEVDLKDKDESIVEEKDEDDFVKLIKEELNNSDSEEKKSVVNKEETVIPSSISTSESVVDSKFNNVIQGSSKTGLGNLNLPLVASPSMLVQCSSLVSSESSEGTTGKSIVTLNASSTNIPTSKNSISDSGPTEQIKKLPVPISPPLDAAVKSQTSESLEKREEERRKLNESAGLSLALLCNSDLASHAFHSSTTQHSPSLSVLSRQGTLPFTYNPLDAKASILGDGRAKTSADILTEARNNGMFLGEPPKAGIALENNLCVAPLASSNMAAIEAANMRSIENREDKDLSSRKSFDRDNDSSMDLDRSGAHSPAYSDISDANDSAPMLEKESEDDQDGPTASGNPIIASGSAGLKLTGNGSTMLAPSERIGIAAGGYLYSPIYGQPPYLTPVVTGSPAGVSPTAASNKENYGSPDGKIEEMCDTEGSKDVLRGSSSMDPKSFPGVPRVDAVKPESLPGFPTSSAIPIMHPMLALTNPAVLPGAPFAFADPRFPNSQAANSWLMHQQLLQQPRMLFQQDLTRLSLSGPPAVLRSESPLGKDKPSLPTPPSLIPDKVRASSQHGEGGDAGDNHKSKSRSESPATESSRFLPHRQQQRQGFLSPAGVENAPKHSGDGVGSTGKPSAVVAPQSRASSGRSRPGDEPLERSSDSRDSVSRGGQDSSFSESKKGDGERSENRTPGKMATKNDSRSYSSSVIKSKDEIERIPGSVTPAIPAGLASPASPFPAMFPHYLTPGAIQYPPGFPEHPGIYPPGIGSVIGFAPSPSGGFLPAPLLAPAPPIPPIILSPNRSQPNDTKVSIGALPPRSNSGYFNPAGIGAPIGDDRHLHKIHELKDVGKSGAGAKVGVSGETKAPSPPEAGDGVRTRPDSRSGRCSSVGTNKEQDSPPTQRHHHMHHHMHLQFNHTLYPPLFSSDAAAAFLASQQATSAAMQRPPYMGKS